MMIRVLLAEVAVFLMKVMLFAVWFIKRLETVTWEPLTSKGCEFVLSSVI